MAEIEVHLLPLTLPEPLQIIVTDESFVIGREIPAFRTWKDARLKRLSREHARVVIDRCSARVCDLHSTNGTKINNTPLVSQDFYAIKDGDIVNFANVLKFEVNIVRRQVRDVTVVT